MQPGVPFNLTPAEQEALQQQADELRSHVMPDLQAALAQAQMMQQKLMEAQQQIAATEVQGQAGGGMVVVALNGSGEVLGIRIDPQVVDPGNVENLQNLVVWALRDAAENMREQVKAVLGPLAAESGQPLPE